MNRFALFVIAAVTLVLLVVPGCAGGQVASTPTQTANPASQPTAVPSPTAQSVATATNVPAPAATATQQPRVTEAPTQTPAAGLTLTVTEPQDESVVNGSLLEVVGQTAPDAIVSVNGNMVNSIDANGNFTTVVPLVAGPNLVEVIASDYQNNQVSRTLTVISTQ